MGLASHANSFNTTVLKLEVHYPRAKQISKKISYKVKDNTFSMVKEVKQVIGLERKRITVLVPSLTV